MRRTTQKVSVNKSYLYFPSLLSRKVNAICCGNCSSRGKRSPRHRQRQNLSGSGSLRDKDRLITDGDATYRKYPGVNNVAYVVGHTHAYMWFHWTKTRKLTITISLPVVRCRSAPRCRKPFSYWWGVFGPWITTIWPRPCSAQLCSPSANHRRSPATDALLIGWCFCSGLTLFSRKPRSSNVHWRYCGHWRWRNQPRSALQPVLTPCTPMGLLFLPSSPCTQSFLCGEWLWIFEW